MAVFSNEVVEKAVRTAAEEVPSYQAIHSDDAKEAIIHLVIQFLLETPNVNEGRFHNVHVGDLFSKVQRNHKDEVKGLNQKYGMTGRNKTSDKVARAIYSHAFSILKNTASKAAQGNSEKRRMPSHVLRGSTFSTRAHGNANPNTRRVTLWTDRNNKQRRRIFKWLIVFSFSLY